MTANTSPTLDAAQLAHLQTWQGKSETLTDTVTAWPVAALAATLDCDAALAAALQCGDAPLPPLWHWLYFLPHARTDELGADGHPRRGGFLPPVPLPRRMWAGARLAWQAGNALRVGQSVRRTSRIAAVQHKSGRSGELLFVQVHHEYHNDGGMALREEHDIVYRSAANAQAPAPAPQTPPLAGQADFSRTIAPHAPLLFRYSALTFNGHRIHYDQPYATQAEGYPGLVVHGPLIATLLLDLVQRHMPQAQIAAFDFRAVRPTFDLHPFSVHGKFSPQDSSVQLWAQDHEGCLTMQATAKLQQQETEQ